MIASAIQRYPSRFTNRPDQWTAVRVTWSVGLMVRYTPKFKEEFWKEYSEEHTAPNTIFQRHGFDTERLGYWRAVGFTRNLVKAHRSEEAQTKESYSQKQQEDAAKHKDVQRLEHKVELLEQQLEYIKKL